MQLTGIPTLRSFVLSTDVSSMQQINLKRLIEQTLV